MKILQVPFTFYPDPCGGTEVYVEALARGLKIRGWTPLIAAPASRNDSYHHSGLAVHRFASTQGPICLEDLYGAGDPEAAMNFGTILDRVQPDLVHVHAMSPAISIRLVRAILQRKLHLIYTFHTPTASCQRGTLLKWGNKVCDGTMDPDVCAACALQGRGVPKILALGINRLSKIIGRSLENSQKQGGVWTALRTPWLVRQRLEKSMEFFRSVDHIVAVCDWVKALLLRNGLPGEKITLSRQGLCQEINRDEASDNPGVERVLDDAFAAPELLLRLVFLGRLDPTKGPHILVCALRKIPEVNVHLAIYGIAQGEEGKRYEAELRSQAGDDERIRFFPPVPASEVVKTLRQYDVLVVPSQWLETGPMVVLEAFAAGIPVMGSKLGGIGELIQHGVNGVLVEASDIHAWAREIQAMVSNEDLIPKLRKGIQPPRTMATVTTEMEGIYRMFLPGRNLSHGNEL